MVLFGVRLRNGICCCSDSGCRVYPSLAPPRLSGEVGRPARPKPAPGALSPWLGGGLLSPRLALLTTQHMAVLQSVGTRTESAFSLYVSPYQESAFLPRPPLTSCPHPHFHFHCVAAITPPPRVHRRASLPCPRSQVSLRVQLVWNKMSEARMESTSVCWPPRCI